MIERYTTKEISEIWSEHNQYKIWLTIEIAVLKELESAGLAELGNAAIIQSTVVLNPNRVREIELKVRHDIIAFLTHISEQVGDKARSMHRGMTSNDLIDTTYAVQLKATHTILTGSFEQLQKAIKDKALQHRSTVCIGRSHGMHAEPTSFGLKLLGWYAELARAKARLDSAFEEVCVGKIAGPVGTYASIAPEIETKVLAALGINAEEVPTQVVARDRHAALFAAFAVLGSSIERWVTEIRHLQRSEVAEAAEPFAAGQKGSSAMPHKRNPILCENLTGLARLLRGYQVSALENVALWHERDISHSSVERVITPDACNLVHFMLKRVTTVIEGLEVNTGQMSANLALSGGAVFSGPVLLGLVDRGMTREDAYAAVQRAAHRSLDNCIAFTQSALQEPAICSILSKEEIEKLTSAAPHLAHVDYIFDRTFAKYSGS